MFLLAALIPDGSILACLLVPPEVSVNFLFSKTPFLLSLARADPVSYN